MLIVEIKARRETRRKITNSKNHKIQNTRKYCNFFQILLIKSPAYHEDQDIGKEVCQVPCKSSWMKYSAPLPVVKEGQWRILTPFWLSDSAVQQTLMKDKGELPRHG